MAAAAPAEAAATILDQYDEEDTSKPPEYRALMHSMSTRSIDYLHLMQADSFPYQYLRY